MVRLSVDDLVAEAVDAFKNNECIEEPPEEPPISVRHLSIFVLSCPVKFKLATHADKSLLTTFSYIADVA